MAPKGLVRRAGALKAKGQNACSQELGTSRDPSTCEDVITVPPSKRLRASSTATDQHDSPAKAPGKIDSQSHGSPSQSKRRPSKSAQKALPKTKPRGRSEAASALGTSAVLHEANVTAAASDGLLKANAKAAASAMQHQHGQPSQTPVHDNARSTEPSGGQTRWSDSNVPGAPEHAEPVIDPAGSGRQARKGRGKRKIRLAEELQEPAGNDADVEHKGSSKQKARLPLPSVELQDPAGNATDAKQRGHSKQKARLPSHLKELQNPAGNDADAEQPPAEASSPVLIRNSSKSRQTKKPKAQRASPKQGENAECAQSAAPIHSAAADEGFHEISVVLDQELAGAESQEAPAGEAQQLPARVAGKTRKRRLPPEKRCVKCHQVGISRVESCICASGYVLQEFCNQLNPL